VKSSKDKTKRGRSCITSSSPSLVVVVADVADVVVVVVVSLFSSFEEIVRSLTRVSFLISAKKFFTGF
jgi:hypothetical protein